MTENTYKPRYFRIYSHRTKTRILHIGDALDLDRIHLDLYDYERGQGTKGHVEFFIHRTEARIIFSDMITCSLPTDPKGIYLELMSGTPRDGKLQARTFKIEVIGTPDARKPLAFEVMNCEGERMGEGAVKPKRGAQQTRVRALMDWRTARKVALSVLSHMNAWEAASYHSRIAAETWQPDEQPPLIDPPAAPDPQPGRDAKPAYQPTEEQAERNRQAQLKTAKQEARKAGISAHVIAQIEMATPLDTLGKVEALRLEITRLQENPTGSIPGKKFNRAGLVLALQEKLYHATVVNASVPSVDPLWQWKWTWQKMVEFGQSLTPLIAQADSQA